MEPQTKPQETVKLPRALLHAQFALVMTVVSFQDSNANEVPEQGRGEPEAPDVSADVVVVIRYS